LTPPLARQVVSSASNPWYTTVVPVLAAAVLMTWVGIANDTTTACSPEAPCGPDHLASIGMGLLFASVLAVRLSALTALVAGVVSMAVGVGKGGLNPTGSLWVYATIALFLGTLVWAAAREHRAARAPRRLLIEAGAPTATVPGTSARPTADDWRAVWTRRSAVITLALLAGALALVARGAWLAEHHAAQEADARVTPVIVTAHEDEFVIRVLVPGAGQQQIDTLDASQYPVPSVQDVWVLPDGDFRLVAEPYDATVLETPAAIALVFAAALIVRAERSRRELVGLRTRPQPMVTMQAYRTPEDEGSLLYPQRSEASTPGVILLPPSPGTGLQPSTDRSLEPITCYGVPAPGHWVVPQWADGFVGDPVRAAGAAAALPAGAVEDADNALLRVYSRDDLAPEDRGRVATSGEHRAPRWMQVLTVTVALLVTAAGPLLERLTDWTGPAPKLATLATGLLLLGSAWRRTIRRRITWDTKGITYVPEAGQQQRVPWEGIEGAFVDGSEVNLVLAPEPEDDDPEDTDAEESDADDEFEDDDLPPGELDLRTLLPVRAANPKLGPLGAGWRTPSQLRAVLLAAHQRSVTPAQELRGVVPVHEPGPRRPWVLWLVWALIAAATLVA
jgi:hypothetical protein